MSLTQALNTSMSGLRVTQAGLGLVASNVANAETPGYVRKTLTPAAVAPSGIGISVRVSAINREIDQYIYRQLRTELSGGSYADMQAQFYSRLQGIYGEPGSVTSIDSVFNNFTASLQALATNPDQYSAQTGVLGAAQQLTQQLNAMSHGIQQLRMDAEHGLADAAFLVNDALEQIASINQQMTTASGQDLASANLLDQRDRYLAQLSELMDVRVVETGNNQVSVFTGNGLQLVGYGAATLTFDPQGSMSSGTQWSADPDKRSVGTLTLRSVTGSSVDLIELGAIRSGKIAALLQMRDDILVEAQNQLDALAAGMSQALSDQTTAGTPATSGVDTGFEVDLSGMLAGNTISVSYLDTLTNRRHTVTLMRVDTSDALPLSNDVTAHPNDRVVGIDFSGGIAAVRNQIAAALGPAFDVSNPAGSNLRILGSSANFTAVEAVSITKTITGLSSGTAALPFFHDGGAPYSGAMTPGGAQIVGYAGRITVNAGLLAEPSRLVAYQPGTLPGDQTRPDFLFDRLTNASITFSSTTGVGTGTSPFSGSVPSFLRQIVAQQGQAAAAASSLKEGQEVVLNALKKRVDDASGVNIDQEMANLLNLQNAYAANARVMTAVKDLFDLLLRM